MKRHLTAAEFQAILAGSLSETDAALLEHLRGCTDCQTSLDQQMDDADVGKWRQVLREDDAVAVAESDAKFLQQLMHSPCATEEPASAPMMEGATTIAAASDTVHPAPLPEPYDFLAPAKSPEEMGRLGPYRVLTKLGAGAMGMVFVAEDIHLKRQVALKVMRPDLVGKPGARARFLREAQAAAKLEHEHIVTVFQVGEEGGMPYLAMQLLKGRSLEDRLRQAEAAKPPAFLGVPAILRLGRQIARGLAAAHQHRLVHRDIKPANIFLVSDAALRGGVPADESLEPTMDESPPTVKILDFGLARPVVDDAHLTQSGTTLGTPFYMAPEQARGEAVDHRCDLFSLGVVLYRMCTGQLPFRGHSTMAILTSLAVHSPTPVRQVNPAVAPDLADLVMQLLSKDPAMRPASAQEVAERLHALERSLTVPVAKAVAAPIQPAELPNPWVDIDMTEPQSVARPESSKGVLTLHSRPSKTPGVPPGGRRKRWPLVAAGLLLLIGGIAFGVYQLTYKTPHGTLVVEIDDKDVEARFQNGELRLLDADGKLKYVLKPSEKNKTLPPGEYRIEVTGADGLKLDTDRFEMHKGDKVTVRVLLKAEAVAKASAPVAVSPEPFVILARRAQPPKAFATLQAAMAAAKSGDTIEIYGDGPFDCTAFEIGAKDLVIRAGAGFRPRLQYGRPDAPLTRGRHLLSTTGRLVLEGLEFQRCSASEASSVYGSPSGSLHVAHCRFLSQKPGEAIFCQSPSLRVRRCEFLETATWGSIYWFPPDGGKASVEGCVFYAKPPRPPCFMCLRPMTFPKYSLDIQNNTTFAASSSLAILFPTASREEIAAARKSGRVRFSNNALVGFQSIVSYHRWRVFKDVMSAQQAVDAMPSILDWSDQGNAYPTNQQFLSVNDEVEPLSAPEIKSLNDWHKWWGIADSSSVQGDLRFANALTDAPDLERITPAQFRLAAGSIGKGTGPGGRDVGADVDTVGPGAPYEAWKKTADYQQWLKDTGQVEISDPQRETVEWVLARGGAVQISGVQGNVTRGDQIPPGPVRITGVYFDWQSKYRPTDDDLERFRPCVELVDLSFYVGCDVTDAGLAKLAAFPKPERFWSLHLYGAKLTPDCIASLAHFKSLHQLGLAGAPLGDAGLTVVAKFKDLERLGADGWGVTDDGLAYLRGLTKLVELHLCNNPKVTDAGLKMLRELRDIEFLTINDTGVTDAGLETVAAWTKLKWLGISIPVTDAGLAKLKDMTELIELGLNGTKVTDAGLVHLRGMRKLTKLHLPTTAVTDKGLDQLVNLISLSSLDLRNTGVTAAGVKKLATALPRCRIVWDGGVIEPKADPQRETAEWVLARGGRLSLDGGDDLVSKPDQIPPGPVQIRGVRFDQKSNVADDDLERFRPCTQLERLWFSTGCDVTDTGLAKLASFPNVDRLTDLVLNDAKLTPACLGTLPRFKSLKRLDLDNAPLGDVGLTVIAKLKNLRALSVQFCGVTDEGLADFRGRKLAMLQVSGNPKVTDAGLRAIREVSWYLNVNVTGVTDAGLDTIAGWTKLEVLYLQNIPVSDTGLSKLKYLTELGLLALNGTKVTDAGLTHLRGMEKLTELYLPGTAVTDKGLNQLSTLASLRKVDLRSTGVTAAGVNKLAAALPRCKIEWDGGVIEPKADPQRETAEWVLSSGGTIKIRQDVQEKDIQAAKDLPAARFEVVSVSFERNSKVDDAGLAHLKRLTTLTHLDLATTQITDAGLEHLKGLTNLTSLRLGYTRLTDAGLEHLKGLTNLTFLGLYGERVSDAGLVHLKAMTKLTGLNLTDTQVSDAGLEHLKTLANLTDLRVGGTQVSNAGLEHLKTFADHLVVLDLTGTRVTDAGLLHLKGLTKLSWLFLSGTRVTDGGLEHLKGLTNLTRLSLPVQVTNAGLVHLKRLSNLERLHLEGTQVSDAGMEHLKGLTNLTDLALGGTQVSDHGLVYLKGLTKLATLGLHNTAVSDAGTTHLAGLTSLTGLWLDHTRISNAGLKHLYALTSLQELHLTGSKVTADGVAALQKALPKCKIVKEGGVIEPSKK